MNSALDIAKVPPELTALQRWVCWRRELRPHSHGIEKPTKVPYNARTGKEASSTNPETWTDFETALAAVGSLKCDGVGIVLNGDGLVGIDLDKCIDEDGNVETWAQEILSMAQSYTEFSPSRRGFRIFAYGKLPPEGRKKGQFEIYETARYLTVTGDHVEGLPLTIEKRASEILAIHSKMWPQKDRCHRNNGNHKPKTASCFLDDRELFALARNARNGKKFSNLFDRGLVNDYPSQSEAEMALCCMLAFYTKDPDRIADLVRQSALYRDKWEREDYRERTIQNAIELTTETFSPERNADYPNNRLTSEELLEREVIREESREPLEGGSQSKSELHRNCIQEESPADKRHWAYEESRQRLGLVVMSNVEPESVRWLWRPRIPLGKVTLIDGDPGLGKSFITLAIATAVSLGRGLPGEEPTLPGRVLLISAEDGLADTVRPRLNAMAANASMITAISKRVTLDHKGCTEIENVLTVDKPRLVIIDPLFAYTGAKVDIHRANETRDIMDRLARLAAMHGCAILCVRHLTKGDRVKSIYRGIGSIDVTAACRSVLLVGADVNDIKRRAIVQIKNNLAPLAEPIGYSLADGQFSWTGASDLTAEQILGSERNASDALPVEEAGEFLRELLKSGPMSQKAVEREARKAGIRSRTLYRAKAALEVDSAKSGFRGAWVWVLPAKIATKVTTHDE